MLVIVNMPGSMLTRRSTVAQPCMRCPCCRRHRQHVRGGGTSLSLQSAPSLARIACACHPQSLDAGGPESESLGLRLRCRKPRCGCALSLAPSNRMLLLRALAGVGFRAQRQQLHAGGPGRRRQGRRAVMRPRANVALGKLAGPPIVQCLPPPSPPNHRMQSSATRRGSSSASRP